MVAWAFVNRDGLRKHTTGNAHAARCSTLLEKSSQARPVLTVATPCTAPATDSAHMTMPHMASSTQPPLPGPDRVLWKNATTAMATSTGLCRDHAADCHHAGTRKHCIAHMPGSTRLHHRAQHAPAVKREHRQQVQQIEARRQWRRSHRPGAQPPVSRPAMCS